MYIKKLLPNFRMDTSAMPNPVVDSYGSAFRRIHERRNTDLSVAQVNDMVYPVENWSQGGTLLGGDSRFFTLDQVYDLTLRFKLSDRVLNIQHPARVVRKSGDRTAFQFLPLTSEIRQKFSQVLDDLVTNNFAQSQT